MSNPFDPQVLMSSSHSELWIAEGAVRWALLSDLLFVGAVHCTLERTEDGAFVLCILL